MPRWWTDFMLWLRPPLNVDDPDDPTDDPVVIDLVDTQRGGRHAVVDQGELRPAKRHPDDYRPTEPGKAAAQ